jgi:hypothetical protein
LRCECACCYGHPPPPIPPPPPVNAFVSVDRVCDPVIGGGRRHLGHGRGRSAGPALRPRWPPGRRPSVPRLPGLQALQSLERTCSRYDLWKHPLGTERARLSAPTEPFSSSVPRGAFNPQSTTLPTLPSLKLHPCISSVNRRLTTTEASWPLTGSRGTSSGRFSAHAAMRATAELGRFARLPPPAYLAISFKELAV